MPDSKPAKKILISGGGIAGLTLSILLYEKGWEPVIIERDLALRAEGYMMDFFGTGWDVAERMGMLDSLRDIHYPIDYIEYVDNSGRPYFSIPVSRVRKALNGRYAYLRRSDLEQILFERAKSIGLNVRFGTTISALHDADFEVEVVFNDGKGDAFALVFGADGVHSRVRELIFGPEAQFDRFLGYYVVAFHTSNQYGVGNSVKLYEEPDRVACFYPLDEELMDAVYIFRHPDVGVVPEEQRLPLVERAFQGAGWIAEQVLQDLPPASSVFFDSTTQIVMPAWTKGRVALLGDACGCLTLIAGQGSHMAMAGAYVIARELERHGPDYPAALNSYEAFLKPFINKKQKDAVRLSRNFVPSRSSNIMLRHTVIRLLFSKMFARWGLSHFFGARSVLERYQ